MLTACGGGGGSNGGNNSQSLREARTLWSNLTHNDGVTEAYTLEFTAVDAAASNFTLYIWGAEFVPPNPGTPVALDVHIYPDGGAGESCSLSLADNTVVDSCQFTQNNTNQLNLDITNNSGNPVTYEYIFLPGTTPVDGSMASPFRILNSVIHDTDVAWTAGIVGGAGSSSYYVANTGADTTSLGTSELIAVLGNNSELTIEMFSDSDYSVPVDECSSGGCYSFYNLTANTDYYLKITNNGSGTSNPIIYQLDLTPGNDSIFDYGLQVSATLGSGSAGLPYSVYMFDSSGVAQAGLWSNNVLSGDGSIYTTMKTIDANGCVTNTNASQVTSGTYSFVLSMHSGLAVFYGVSPLTDKPTACAGTDGYISNGYEGGVTTLDMSTVDPVYGVNLASDAGSTLAGTSSLQLDIVTGSVQAISQLTCSAYMSGYTGTDDKNRLATFTQPVGSGTANFSTGDLLRLAAGSYRLYCLSDEDNSGGESTGDLVFDTTFDMPDISTNIAHPVDATTGWSAL
ncbi:MAG: hypothetical protein OEY09_11780 [Gammaproteobacteria bacterium]|nr:hypothetical protein [Gammaproteobacteria bacterium]